MLQSLFDIYSGAAIKVGLFTLVGFLIDFAVYRIWISRTRTTEHQVAGAVARATHWLPTLAALLIGVRLATPSLELGSGSSAFISTTSQVVAILAVTAKLAILAGRIVRIVTSREDNPLPSSTIFVNLARGTVWLIGLLILLAALQVSIAPLVTALGVGGLAVGLALQPTLENLFGGIQVLMSRQIDPGDFIRLESGEEGWVRDVTWRNTTIQMVSNDLVIVPNALIAKSRIVNFTSLDEQHTITVPVGVAFDSDLEHVERVTVAVAAATQRETEGAVFDWEPLVRFYEFGASAVNLIVVLRVERYDMRYPVRHAFIKRLHAMYADENIEVPYPQTTVHMASQPELGAPRS